MSNSSQYIPGVAELGRKNQPGGYVGIDGSGDVLGTFAQRYDTAANIASIVLKNGELAFTTDTQETFIGDGVTAGGVFVSQQWQTFAQRSYPENTLTSDPDGPNAEVIAVKPGSYEILFYAVFLLETSNTSNFAVTVSPLASNDNTKLFMYNYCWTNQGGTKFTEQKFAGLTGNIEPWMAFALQDNLDRPDARLMAEVKINVTSSGVINVTPIRRLGVPTSAMCILQVMHRRIA